MGSRPGRNNNRTNRLILMGGLSLIILPFLLSLPSISLAAFQEALWGARPSAMAGAFTAVADDANAPAYNPAGISLVTNNEMTLMYARLFSGLDLQTGDESSRLGLGYFSYVPQIADKRYGSYAFSWTNFVASSLYREDTFSLTYADSWQFDEMVSQPVLSYGGNIKYLRRSFTLDNRTTDDSVFQNGSDSNAMTLDLGLLLHPHYNVLPGLKFGLAGKNITEPNVGLAATDRVPASYSLGVAYQDPSMPTFNPSLDLMRREGRTLISAAWEGWFSNETLALRMGGSEDQLGGGVGYNFSLFKGMIFKIDYSLLWPLNVEGTNGSHRVSITTNF